MSENQLFSLIFIKFLSNYDFDAQFFIYQGPTVINILKSNNICSFPNSTPDLSLISFVFREISQNSERSAMQNTAMKCAMRCALNSWISLFQVIF